MSRSRFPEAEAAAQRAVELNPELAESWTTLGTVLAWGLKQAEVATAFERALAINPKQPRVHLSLGHVHKALGNSDASVGAYRNAAAADAGLGEAWWSLADLKTYRFTDTERNAMEAAQERKDLFGRDRAALHFALGKAFEDRGDVDQAFEHYRRGNDLRASHESFNVETVSRPSAGVCGRRLREPRSPRSGERRGARRSIGLPYPSLSSACPVPAPRWWTRSSLPTAACRERWNCPTCSATCANSNAAPATRMPPSK